MIKNDNNCQDFYSVEIPVPDSKEGNLYLPCLLLLYAFYHILTSFFLHTCIHSIIIHQVT